MQVLSRIRVKCSFGGKRRKQHGKLVYLSSRKIWLNSNDGIGFRGKSCPVSMCSIFIMGNCLRIIMMIQRWLKGGSKVAQRKISPKKSNFQTLVSPSILIHFCPDLNAESYTLKTNKLSTQMKWEDVASMFF